MKLEFVTALAQSKKFKLTKAKLEELSQCIYACKWDNAEEIAEYIKTFIEEVQNG